MYWSDGVHLLQSALWLSLWLSLPLLGAIAAAGLLGAVLQSLLGLSDPAALLAPRLLGALVAGACFGTWMLALMCHYWGGLWSHAAPLVAGR